MLLSNRILSWPLAKVFSRFCSLIIGSLKVLRTPIAQGRMPAHPVVVTFDIGEGLHPRLFDIGKRAAFEQLRLVARKQTLGVRIVVGLLGAAHALLES